MDPNNDNQVEIELGNQDGFVNFLKSLPTCPPQTIRLFNRNDFYTIHGENAIFVAQTFLNTMTSIKLIGNGVNKVESVVISGTRFEPLLHHLLIDNNFCIEIYTNKGNKYQNDWKLTTKASPSNLGTLEDLVHSFNTTVLNQVILALFLEAENIYFLCFDVLKCSITVGSFKDDNNCSYLETLLIQLNPRECFIPEKDPKNRITNILDRNQIIVKEYSISNTNFDQIEQSLDKFLKPECSDIKREIFTKYRLAFTPLIVLINYLRLGNDPYCQASYFLTELIIDSYVHLDLSSLQNLHLFPSPGEMRSKSCHSLYQLLNHCQTLSGKVLLDKFIRRPELNLETIEQRLNIVEYFIENWSYVTSKILENILPKIPDITKIYKKFINGRCSLKELYQMYLTIEQLPLLLEIFSHLDKSNSLENCVDKIITTKLNSLADKLLKLKDLIYNSIDLDHYLQTRELWIRASFSEELQELKDDIDSIDQEANKQFSLVSRSIEKSINLSKANVKMELDKNGYYFRVTKANVSDVLKCKDYMEVSGSSKDGRFINNELDSINSRYLLMASKYDRMQQKYIKQLIDDARIYLDHFLEFEYLLSYIDTLIAFSKAARNASSQYVRPKILPKGSGKIILRQFRHPIIEFIKQSAYVPNDICLDQDGQKFFVITGPNMGGKSTFIRSVALNVLMAQIGSFVPADEAEISIVDAIYSRLNASDDPKTGLSTFMAEMIETSSILKTATENSLVIIDELGRSTGSSDGFGLATSIVNRLVNKVNIFGLFATHFHDLAEYNDKVGKLFMKSEIIDGELIVHYRAQSGTSHQSFGIEIAKALKLSPKIIENAENRLKLNGSSCKQYLNNIIHTLKNDLKDSLITKESIKKHLENISLEQIMDEQSNKDDYIKILNHQAMVEKCSNNSSNSSPMDVDQ